MHPSRRIPFASLTALLFLGAATAQDTPFDGPAALARYHWIVNGEYQRTQHGVPAPARDDIELCRRGMLETGDDSVRSYACLALEKLVREPCFGELAPAARAALVPPLLAAMASPHADTAEWSTRALEALARAKNGLAAPDVRTTVVKCLDLVTKKDFEVRRRAGLLLEALADRCGAIDHQQMARTLQLTLDRYPLGKAADDRERTARTTLLGVLTRLAPGEKVLADELATRFLADLGGTDAFGFHYERADALRGIGRQFSLLQGDRRTASIAALLAGVGEQELRYMRTSGRRTPFQHAGSDALVLAVPSLSATECARASAAVVAARAAAQQQGDEPQDLAGMFDAVEQVLAARRQALK